MATGTVKWFNTQKGYGFIQPDDGSADVFVHISAVERSGIGYLNDSQTIGYEVKKAGTARALLLTSRRSRSGARPPGATP
jgi:cold shock protein